MKKFVFLAATGLLLAGILRAAPEAAPRAANYTNAAYGFSLAAPNYPKAGPGQPSIPVIFSGPGVNGFASNVNVNVQQMSTTRKAYAELSLTELGKINLKVNSTRELTVSGKDAIQFDYEGEVSGKDLRFLALAVIEKERVILVTCTALKTAFKEIEPEFQACLDSFRLD